MRGAFFLLGVYLIILQCRGESPPLVLPGGGGGLAACTCTAEYNPVCGWNKKTYGNECQAGCENEDIRCHGECPCDKKPEKKKDRECIGHLIRCANPCEGKRCPRYPYAECRPDFCHGCNDYDFYVGKRKVECNGAGHGGGDRCRRCHWKRHHPVCDIYETTHDNACYAECKGVKIDCEGTCPCEKKPDDCICTKEYRPVCDIHQKTHGNKCMAECKNADIDCEGECPCKKKPKDCVCTLQYDPVCDIHGKTHGNACSANCHNAPIACNHECPCETKCKHPPVQCFADPCSVTKCEAHPDATCRSNYCGGCNAEFYKNGRRVNCEVKHKYCAEEGKSCRDGSYRRHRMHSGNGGCCHGLQCCYCSPVEYHPRRHNQEGLCYKKCPPCLVKG